jgi:hypothetical protein
MTKADQTILLQRKRIEWIAVGVFAEAEPLVAAVTELTSAGVSLADLCLAGTPASMRSVAAAPEVRSLDRLTALLQSAAEMKLPGSELTILAVPTCVGNPSSVVSAETAERLRRPIADGCILLGVPAASAGEAARVGRILLRHSSHHVHVLQCPAIRPQ